MPLAPTLPTNATAQRWGAASKYRFDDPTKWFTKRNVPVLDEHSLTNEAGQDTGYVDRRVLEQIAANNNRRVLQTGDPAPLIIGHTSDDPQAPEKPVVGYAVNYRVRPYERNPDGSVKYAIFTDFKFRPKYREAADDYPRRSVELWLSRKELDPIAILGGTTPERDLGLIIRNGRFKAFDLDRMGTDGSSETVIRYARNGEPVYRYAIECATKYADDKFGKVMSEFKHGDLHSGSKRGPRVTSRQQAQAIAASEAGISKNARGETDMPKPSHYSHDMSGDGAHQYAADPDAEPEDDMDPEPDPAHDAPDGMDDGDDPVVDKVLSSKKFLETIRAAVTQAIDAAIGGGEEPGMDDGMGEEPGVGAAPPPAGAPGAAPPGAGAPPDEEAAMFHGDRPVKFNTGSAMPGPSTVYAPGIGETGERYARRPAPAAPRSRPMTRTESDEVVRLRRQTESQDKTIRDLVLRNARADARETVNQLKAEGIVFGPSPEEEAKGEQRDIEFLARLDRASRQDYIDNTIRAKYARRRGDPATAPGIARYAAPGVVGTDDLDPSGVIQTDQDATHYANLVGDHGMKPEEALKFMRQQQRGVARTARRA